MANPANTTAYALKDGRMAVNVTENKTLTVDDSGFVQNVITDGVVVSIPATATLGNWTIRNGGAPIVNGPVGTGADGTVGFSVSPVSADRLSGGVAGTATDNKDVINTKATALVGDEITVSNVGETNGPIITNVKGKFVREA